MTYRSYHDATTRSSVLAAVKDTGDAAAWARFFDLYAGFVFAIARSKGLTSEDADDIVQGVFSELARKMPTFEYEGIDTEIVMRLHGMTRDNIYQIRARFTAKLKTLVETIRTEMDEGRFGFA